MALTDEIAAAQADFVAQLCDKTCTIQRATKADDGKGHKIATYNAIASNVPCALARPSGGLMAIIATRYATLSTWDVSLPAGTDIRETDRIVVGGLTLDVMNVYAPESWQILLHVLAAQTA